MKFREHRGTLDDSMATVVDLPDREALIAHCWTLLGPFKHLFKEADLKVKPYCMDQRIGWNTHIVTLANYGVLGFTDGPA